MVRGASRAEVPELLLQRALGVEVAEAGEHDEELELQQLAVGVEGACGVLGDDEGHVVVIHLHLHHHPLLPHHQRRPLRLPDLNQRVLVSLDDAVVLKNQSGAIHFIFF